MNCTCKDVDTALTITALTITVLTTTHPHSGSDQALGLRGHHVHVLVAVVELGQGLVPQPSNRRVQVKGIKLGRPLRRFHCGS